MDEDEDVTLPVTELGKYLTTQDVFGHFQALSSLSESENSIGLDKCTVGSKYGFICGRKLPNMDWNLIVPISLKRLCESEFFMYIGALTSATLSWLNKFYDQLLKLFINLSKIIGHWKHPFYSHPTKAEQIAYKFSLEHRIWKDGIRLKECSSKLDSSISALTNSIQKLYGRKESSHCFDKNVSIGSEIVEIRESISHQMIQLQNLLSSQDNAIKQLLRRKRIPKIQEKPEESPPIVEENLEIQKDSSNLYSNPEKTVFEHCEVSEDSVVEESPYTSFDEVFELKFLKEPELEDAKLASFGEDNMREELKANHAEVMAQLRASLFPLRADMKERENQAYLKTYGKLPEEPEEEELALPSLRTNPSHHNTQLISSQLKMSQESDGMDESFGDEVDECGEEEVKSDFLAKLQNLLQSRGVCGSSESYG